MEELMHNGDAALITGANKGIGREIARRLAAEGMTVYAGARDEEQGRTTARELAGDVRFVHLDVTREDAVHAAVDRIRQESGRLDVLVNNAGVATEWGVDPADVRAELLRREYEVNVFGVVTVTRAAIPLLRRSAAARVVNMSSPLGSLTLMTDPASPVSQSSLLAYNSSKAALNALTVMYANVLRPDGILVNAANPGLVATDLNGFTAGATTDGLTIRTPERGAEVPVRLALLGPNGPTGRFFGDDEFAVAGIVPW
jgi:NAD(P)-dependent dehydrogenase (short-subunit alcohol dehydrogenase family)